MKEERIRRTANIGQKVTADNVNRLEIERFMSITGEMDLQIRRPEIRVGEILGWVMEKKEQEEKVLRNCHVMIVFG